MWVWDYKINDTWQPKTTDEWKWFLVRKINYGDFRGLQTKKLATYFLGVRIDSLEDNAANKTFAYFDRNEPKDLSVFLFCKQSNLYYSKPKKKNKNTYSWKSSAISEIKPQHFLGRI